MKFTKSFAALAALALAVPMLTQAQATIKPAVAVSPFNNGVIGKQQHEDMEPLSKGVQDLLIGELAANTGITVVERDQLAKILDEQNLAKSGVTDAQSAVKVGKLLGVRYFVFGGFVGDMKGNMKIAPRVVNVETGELVFPNSTTKKRTADGKTENFMQLVNQTAALLNAELKLPEIPVRVGDARKEAAKKVPFEAVALYSQALQAKDEGKKAEAVTLFRKSLDKFPEFEKAKTELAKLQ